MKLIVFILASIGVIVVLFLIYRGFFRTSSSGIEQYTYTVLDTIGDVEIRRYPSAEFSVVQTYGSSYRERSRQGFSRLAGYIFGGNEANQNIAMTSPVMMDLQDSGNMSFLLPKRWSIESLPAPNDDRIHFKKEPEKVVAAIRFSGWASDSRNDKFASRLSEVLANHGIAHSGKFMLLGYNPPYEVINRRNEIIVELEDYPQKNQ